MIDIRVTGEGEEKKNNWLIICTNIHTEVRRAMLKITAVLVSITTQVGLPRFYNFLLPLPILAGHGSCLAG